MKSHYFLLVVITILLLQSCRRSYDCSCVLYEIKGSDSQYLRVEKAGISSKNGKKAVRECDNFRAEMHKQYKPDSNSIYPDCMLYYAK